MTDRQTASETTLLLWVIGLSLAIQIGLMLYVGQRAYFDVIRSVQYGRDIVSGAISLKTHLDQSKTFIGPVLWYSIYEVGGLWGLRLFNLSAFACLLTVQYKLGRQIFSRWIALAAVFLVAFYPGSHRNVAVGEQSDNLAILLVVLAVFVFLRTGRILPAFLLMGAAFLFKFWAAFFIVGFVAHLSLKREWFRPLVVTLLLGGVLFVVLNLLTDWIVLKTVYWSIASQRAVANLPVMLQKQATTGLFAANVLAIWSFLRFRTEYHRLLLFLTLPYFIYTLVSWDAWAATFVMMGCLAFSSFLITDLWASFGWKRSSVSALLALYLLAGVAIAGRNMMWDARAFELPDEVRAPAVKRSRGDSL